MPLNKFDKAVRRLADVALSHVRRQFVYHRGELNRILEGWEGQTVFRTNQSNKVFLDWSGKDFLVVASHLKDMGIQEPEKGDWIERIDEYGNMEPYELAAPPGEPLYRKSDVQGYILRIHTRKTQYDG